jgi:Tol biopolymer transport system component
MRIVTVLLVAMIFPVALAVVVVFGVGQSDRPAEVPANWRAPTELPKARAPLVVGEVLFSSDRAGSYGIYLMRNDGQNVRPVSVDPGFDAWGVRLSPDRLTAIFYRNPADDARDPATASLWAVAADGNSRPVELRPAGLDGWTVQSHAEWDIYGSALIMSGGSRSNPQIWMTNALGQAPRQLTDRAGMNLDPSFSPDGREIFFIGCPGDDCDLEDREIYRMLANGGITTRVTSNRFPEREPSLSPDGGRLMFLSDDGPQAGDGWQIRVARRQSVENFDTAAGMIPTDQLDPGTGRPHWSLDGQTIYVHRKPGGRATAGIYAISTGTTDPIRELTLAQPGNHEDPAL